MKRLPIIRETINYTHQFYDSLIVVRLDDKVAADALERGIFSDITKIRQTGAKVTVVHSSPKLSLIGQKINCEGHDENSIIYCAESDSARCDNVAVDIAVKGRALKLIFVTNVSGIFYPRDILLRQLSVKDTHELLKKPNAVSGTMRGKLEASIAACDRGIDRAHIISGEGGNLLLEIFTCDGVGTMIYSKMPYEQIRQAESGEISDIIEILRATISKSYFNLAQVTKALGDFWVFSVDRDIHGCMQVIDHPNYKMIEIACLAVSPKYENQDTLQRLIKHALEYARAKKREGVFINIRENTFCLPLYPWFMKLGFKRDISSQIPRIDKKTGVVCWVCAV